MFYTFFNCFIEPHGHKPPYRFYVGLLNYIIDISFDYIPINDLFTKQANKYTRLD